MEINNKYAGLEAPWKNNPSTREGLIQRIKQAFIQGANNNQASFTEEKISEEYYKMWLELPASASLPRIAQHPLLTKKNKAVIDEQLTEQKMSQAKWAVGGTAVTLILYSAFFSRMPTFRNFFNHQNSWLITRFLKKTLVTYGLVFIWAASLSSTYEQAMPGELAKKGLLKDLGLLGKPSNN